MDAVQRWKNELKIKELIEVLKKRDFNAVMAEDKEDAKRIVMDMIPEGSVIAVGGSVTLNETGILDEIRSDKYKFIDRYNVASYEEMLDKY